MTISFELPIDVEQRLRAQSPDLGNEARAAYVLELFRGGKLTHYELSQSLGLDRFETDAYLKLHRVFEGSLTSDDLEADVRTLQHVLGSAKS